MHRQTLSAVKRTFLDNAQRFVCSSAMPAQSPPSHPLLGLGGGGWVFLGPNGVGKGTYAKQIAKHLDVPHIAMGDLVRAELEQDTSQSKKVILHVLFCEVVR